MSYLPLLVNAAKQTLNNTRYFLPTHGYQIEERGKRGVEGWGRGRIRRRDGEMRTRRNRRRRNREGGKEKERLTKTYREEENARMEDEEGRIKGGETRRRRGRTRIRWKVEGKVENLDVQEKDKEVDGQGGRMEKRGGGGE